MDVVLDIVYPPRPGSDGGRVTLKRRLRVKPGTTALRLFRRFVSQDPRDFELRVNKHLERWKLVLRDGDHIVIEPFPERATDDS